MNLIDFIVIGIVVLIVTLAIVYIVRQKKKGVKCVGCPMAKQCADRNKNQCNNYKR